MRKTGTYFNRQKSALANENLYSSCVAQVRYGEKDSAIGTAPWQPQTTHTVQAHLAGGLGLPRSCFNGDRVWVLPCE